METMRPFCTIAIAMPGMRWSETSCCAMSSNWRTSKPCATGNGLATRPCGRTRDATWTGPCCAGVCCADCVALEGAGCVAPSQRKGVWAAEPTAMGYNMPTSAARQTPTTRSDAPFIGRAPCVCCEMLADHSARSALCMNKGKCDVDFLDPARNCGGCRVLDDGDVQRAGRRP